MGDEGLELRPWLPAHLAGLRWRSWHRRLLCGEDRRPLLRARASLTALSVGGGTFNALTGRGMRPSPLTGVPIEINGPALDWVIVGSESGPGARPMDTAWARRIVDDCRAAGVAVFTKQIANPNDRKGGDPQFWPPGEWPREFPR